MSQPTPYVRQANFTDHTQNLPDVPQDGTEMDAEFNAVKVTLDETLTNLALIQADDGGLKSGVVTRRSLSDELVLGISKPAISWYTATAYEPGDEVWVSGKLYVCNIAHTSGVFATDLAALRWTQILDASPAMIGVITADAQAAQAGAELAEANAEAAAAGIAALVASTANYWANTAGGTANALVLTTQPTMASYVVGHKIRFIPLLANTGAVNVDTSNGLGSRQLRKNIGNGLVALSPRDLLPTTIAEIEYISDLQGYQLLNPATNSKGQDIASAATLNLGVANGDYVIVTGTTTINAVTLPEGMETTVTFSGSLTMTHSSSLLLKNGGSNMVMQAGDSAIFRGEAGGVVRMVSYTSMAGTSTLRNFIDGFQMSTAGASTTVTTTGGLCTDTVSGSYIADANTVAKTTGSWVVGTGNGGLDTGAIANNTWYHVYAIRRPDTGVVDRCFSLSASAPTIGGAIPAAYTQYRRIGSVKTNGSAQWIRFYQNGDNFTWDTSVLDVNANNPGTSAVTRTLASIPTGIRVYADLVGELYDPASLVKAILLTDLDVADETPTIYNTPSNSDTGSHGSSGSVVGSNMMIKSVRTNTSAQIRSRCGGSGLSASAVLNIRVRGWVDKRGRE